MRHVLEYKGYYTKVEYSIEDKLLHGKIEGINDLVNFECSSADQVEEKFHEAVDDYLLFCQDIGAEPEKCYKGSFNVRLSPELHRRIAVAAAVQGMSLNQFVANAMERSLATC